MEYPIRFSDVFMLSGIFNLTLEQVERLDFLTVDELLFMEQFKGGI